MSFRVRKHHELMHKAKAKFSPEEDDRLSELVEIFGPVNWETIADNMPKRNPRQCRDRWFYYLSPEVSKAPWTAEEDYRLLTAYARLGPKWVQISRCFRDRTDTHIKNRWLVLQRRLKKYGTFQDIEDIKMPLIQGLCHLERQTVVNRQPTLQKSEVHPGTSEHEAKIIIEKDPFEALFNDSIDPDELIAWNIFF